MAQEREGRAAGMDWARIGANVSGPLLTLATAITLDLLTRGGLRVPMAVPVPLLLLPVVYSALRGGLGPGLVSALLVALYGVHYFSVTGQLLRYTDDGFRSAVATVLIAPLMVLLVVAWRRRQASPAGAPAGVAGPAPAGGVLADAAALLSGSPEVETTLQSVTKRAVPAMADWCLVHVLAPNGAVGYVTSSHRDPSSEAALHALRRYAPRELHGGGGLTMPAPVVLAPLDDGRLDAFVQDDEHRRRLQALAPTSCLVTPLVARGRLVGALTLGTSAGSGRMLAEPDLGPAMQLAALAAFAVDGSRLRQDAEAAEQRYRLLFENNPQPMWVFDVETLQFLAVNDAAVRHYGYTRDEFLGMTIMDIRPPEEETATRLSGSERGAGGREQVAITQHQRKDGTVIDVEITSHEVPTGAGRARLVQITDVSDRMRTRAALHQSEEQLRQVQKMDAVGRLASGVAHDFNNLLTAIQGYSELLLRDMPQEDTRRRDVEEIRRSADRGALLTRQLLAFGQRQKRSPQPVDLNAVVRGMETLLKRLVGADISLVSELEPGLGRVRMDPAQAEQVLMNLVLNARDSMAAGGTLTIETAERVVGASTKGRALKPGRYLVLSVSDTGEGMDSEAQARLFQPMLSAKDTTVASGLGLSIVYGIVKQSGGVVRVSSEPGSGTSVRVFLPMLEEPEPDEGEAPAAEPVQLRGLETILLVEDEEAVRELLRKVLTRQGYTVLEARHGRDALMALERHRGTVHLVVTDIVMPEMGGRELADRLRAERSDLKILFISGYTNDEIVRRGVSDSDMDFIQKPFSSDDFLRRVREMLDGEPSSSSSEAPGPATTPAAP